MKKILFVAICFCILSNCSNEPSPTIIYDDRPTPELQVDTTAIKVAGLPVHLDSTDHLLHPIGEYKFYKVGKYLSKQPAHGRLPVINQHGLSGGHYNAIEGNLDNIKFQKIGSDKLYNLTKAKLKIRAAVYHKHFNNNKNTKVLLYRVTDKDTNKNQKLDEDDIESLYISNLDGAAFEKLTPEFQELIDYRVMPIENRIYFITATDANKDGKFDNADHFRYYYLDVTTAERNVIEYDPFK